MDWAGSLVVTLLFVFLLIGVLVVFLVLMSLIMLLQYIIGLI
jgi:hypothetical protein